MKTSWITTTFGVLVIILTWGQQILVEQGVPATGRDWLTFILGNLGGLIGVFAKDFNRSNAEKPVADARPTP